MPTAAIYDCEGPRLNAEERAFFRDVDPWGFIVFGRHCQSADELRAHCDELRDCVGREDTPILIDQEGGRVARLAAPAFPAHPPSAVFGTLLALDRKRALEAARLNAFLLGQLVSSLGVNVDCVPMLDVPQPDADPTVIGDRAYAERPDDIAEIGRVVMEGLIEGGALPVIKHIPGHGRALCDSHFELPRVAASKEELKAVDFAPFRALNDAPMAMTAHVVYEAYDQEQSATTSRTIIDEVIRGDIGFDGLLMSDDLKMKALGGTFEARARDSIAAGCDIALCCNFTLEEKRLAAKAIPELTGRGAGRADAAMAMLRPAKTNDATAQYARLEKLLEPALA